MNMEKGITMYTNLPRSRIFPTILFVPNQTHNHQQTMRKNYKIESGLKMFHIPPQLNIKAYIGSQKNLKLSYSW